MPIQLINLGGYANDGTGDDLRAAFLKVNANFTLLDSAAQINNGANLGSGANVFKGKVSTTLEFRSLTSTDNSVTLTSTANTVNFKANTNLLEDLAPRLGANLNLNGRNIIGTGDVQATVYGVDLEALNAMLALLIESNQNLAVDLGSINTPAGVETNFRGYGLDMGPIVGASPANRFNFGTIV